MAVMTINTMTITTTRTMAMAMAKRVAVARRGAMMLSAVNASSAASPPLPPPSTSTSPSPVATIPFPYPSSSSSSSLGEPSFLRPSPQSSATQTTVGTTPTVKRGDRASPSNTTRSRIKSRKAPITISSEAIDRLRSLQPRIVRLSVRNKGCAGLSYHLGYIEEHDIGKWDEVVEQDGVKMVVDSRALFSVVGSEMGWVEDGISSRFAFKNPNIQDECGCGESFTVGGSRDS